VRWVLVAIANVDRCRETASSVQRNMGTCPGRGVECFHGAGWWVCFFVGIRGGGRCCRGVVSFALASAFCLRASSVAPVRGGTYFSLPPQRKVGKRKRLTPPAHVLIHGPPTSPRFTRQRPYSRALPTLRTIASPASGTRTTADGSEWYVPPRWQTVCRLSRRISSRSYRVGRVRRRSGVRRVKHQGPTHSLPPGRQWTVWHGML